jgi:3-phosphoshikimate 1-carboxyvinyltransferase
VNAVEVLPSGPVHAHVAAPGSKSVTNRVLVLAALADGESLIDGGLESDDSAAMRRVIIGLGARIDRWRVTGTGGRLAVPGAPLDAGLSGTTMRFGTALAALAPGTVILTGRPPLLRRPIAPLTAALRALGADARDRDGFPPVQVGGGFDGGTVVVDSTGSSQFASALLLAAPYARRNVEIAVDGSTAEAYIELTASAACDWGAAIDSIPGPAWRVVAGRHYRPREVQVPSDASAAAHLHALAVATGGEVTVTNATASVGRQPDAGLPHILRAMGARVTRHGDALTVAGPARPRPLDVDLTAMPDQVTTVAALAALADGPSRLRGVAVARTHETDRLAALAKELGKLGVDVEERPDGLDVHGGEASGPARLATYDDHRLAMAFAAIAARIPGVVIEDPDCVAKTYPGFWSDLTAMGVRWRSVT